ncbi:MAG: diguanylate cyclase [Proteobacteria bacterium]|nr:diguanylate cyclase [Pseudomonadota bacterium]
MKITRLRSKLLLGATAMGIVMALTSMLAVSWVISGQYLNQSNALLEKASKIINEDLTDRKNNQLIASRQLAMQKNLGSTIWYLSQYQQADVNREMLFVTYQQLVKDTYKTGRVARLSEIFIYDSKGRLVTFALFDSSGELVGFVEHNPEPVFQVAMLKEGEELNRNNLRAMNSVAKIGFQFSGPLPQQESVHYAVVNGELAIESQVPIMGEAFDPGSGRQEIKQLGLVVTVQPIAQAFVDQLSRLTDTRINVFTTQGYSSGNLPAYRVPNVQAVDKIPALNEVKIEGELYYQSLIPLYSGTRLAGTIAVLNSRELVRKNTWEMIETLGLIALASLLLMLPFSWYLAVSISHPLTVLSRVFLGVASGRETLDHELGELEKRRGDELGDLTRSFIAMNDAVKQKIQQINEINASLEDKIDQRTRELRLANNELTKLATHDVLTGLPNRQLVSDRLVQALTAARRDKAHLALMFIDLDEFKPVNDTYGHDVGDLLLKEVAKRIHGCIRESDTVSRVGGDEFIVLLPIIEAGGDAGEVAEKIRLALNQPFELAGYKLRISSSIGIAIYPEHGIDESTLLKNADTAMYDAKNNGRNTVRLFQPVT